MHLKEPPPVTFQITQSRKNNFQITLSRKKKFKSRSREALVWIADFYNPLVMDVGSPSG